MKLPRNGKEFTLFLAIVSILSVNIIAPLITCFEVGFSLQNWKNTLTILPFIWLAVVVFVLLTHTPASKLAKKIVHEKDSFNAQIIVNILVNVLMMSIILTIVATWIGTRSLTLEPFQHFFYRWPRNFAISLFVEMIIAQPIARFVLHRLHLKIDASRQGI